MLMKSKYPRSYMIPPFIKLKSGYTVSQTLKGLSKAWRGYLIAKKGEKERMVYYASVIQKLQRELGAPETGFPHLVN